MLKEKIKEILAKNFAIVDFNDEKVANQILSVVEENRFYQILKVERSILDEIREFKWKDFGTNKVHFDYNKNNIIRLHNKIKSWQKCLK